MNTTKSINDIWYDSYEQAQKDIRRDANEVMDMMDVNEDEARRLVSLVADAGKQIAYISALGKKAVFKLYNIKDNVSETYEMNTADDWKSLKERLGSFEEQDFISVFSDMRYARATRGKYRMTIEII